MKSMDPIKQILQETRVIAVVGLSPNPQRDSYKVARYMQSKGYRIVPVNPAASEILGEKCYPSLRDIPGKVDMVNVFRPPQYLPEVADAAVDVGAKFLWTQLGVVNEEATRFASEAGLGVVTDRCLMVEHRNLTLAER
jgi:predicted CoA-binding protein